MQNEANEDSSVPLGVIAHYESTVVPYFPAQMETEVYHGGQFFRKLKLTLQSQKKVDRSGTPRNRSDFSS